MRWQATSILLLVGIVSMILAWIMPQAVEWLYRGHFSHVVPAAPIVSLLLAMISVGLAASLVRADQALALSRFLLGPVVLLVFLYALVTEMPRSPSPEYLWLEYLWLVIFVPLATSLTVLQAKSFHLSMHRGLLCDQYRLKVARAIGLLGAIVYGLTMILIGDHINWSLSSALVFFAAIGGGPLFALESYAGLMCLLKRSYAPRFSR